MICLKFLNQSKERKSVKEKSVVKNILLNVIRVSLSVIFPLITFPYVSRVLLTENLGKVNYAQSIENYFALIAALGMSTYAVREGARKRSSKDEFQIFADEVFSVNMITTVAAYLLMTITIVGIPKLRLYAGLILLQSISIILTTVSVDWINSVFEDYFYITVRSFVVQVVLLIVMFVMVKKPEDYYLYALLTVLSNGISCVLNYIYTRKYCRVHLIKNCHFFAHIKNLLVFFANNLAVSLYLNAGTTMLGYMVGEFTVGIYSVAVKVYNVVKAVIAAMFTACIPRLTGYYGKNETEKYKNLVNNVTIICTLFVFPMVTGLILLARPIVLILSGENYIQSVSSLSIISIGIIGAIYGGIATNCVNLPLGREKDNLKATILAAVTNIFLNIILIPLFRENGTAITTVIAEFTVLLYCISTNKEFWNIIDFKKLLPNILISLLESVAIIATHFTLKDMVSNEFIYMFVLILASAVEYIALLIIFRNPMFYNLIAKRKCV